MPKTINSTEPPATKVLTSTSKTQGQRANDFSFASEREIVRFGSECDNEAVDGSCGCRRAMVGIDSRKATTTVSVTALPLTQSEIVTRIQDSYAKSWPGIEATSFDEEIQELLWVASQFPVGSVLEKRGDEFCIRCSD